MLENILCKSQLNLVPETPMLQINNSVLRYLEGLFYFRTKVKQWSKDCKEEGGPASQDKNNTHKGPGSPVKE